MQRLDQTHQFRTIQLFATGIRACSGADEHPLSAAYCDSPVGSQLRPLSPRFALAIVAGMGQPSQIQLALAVLARQLGIDLPWRIVQAKLVVAGASHFLALDTG